MPLVAVALVPAAVLDAPVDGGEEPGARADGGARCRRRERVERAGLDQAFEHALVDEPQVDVLAERVERVDAPELLADAEHREDRALARRS